MSIRRSIWLIYFNSFLRFMGFVLLILFSILKVIVRELILCAEKNVKVHSPHTLRT